MINNKKRIEKLKENRYKGVFGVKKPTFDKMLEILEKSYIKLHARGGSSCKLSVLDKLIIMLSYYREYRTMENMSFDYDVSKSTICESIKWVEDTLIKEGTFALPSKRKLIDEMPEIEGVLVDVMEVSMERPKKKAT